MFMHMYLGASNARNQVQAIDDDYQAKTESKLLKYMLIKIGTILS